MSTIVVKPNNTPDWRTQALLGFIGPVIGDWIKSEREKEVNRKNNAALNEVINRMNLGNSDFSNLPPSMSNSNGGLLGGSGNGWENAFRNMSDNPLATFDANTADIAPTANANVAASLAQPQHRIPTPAEFMQAMANVVGSDTKRFGLVNLENLQKLAAPIMAAYENSRIEQKRNEVADAYAASDNSQAQRDTIMRAYINGLVPHELVTDATHNYEYENPHLIPGAYDAGGENYFYNYNPRTGEYNFSTQVNKSLSPQDVQRGQHNDREYGLKVRQQDFLEEQARIARENPELKPQYGEDGTLYYVNPYTGSAVYALTTDGEKIKVDHDSYSKNKTNSSANWTAQDRARIQAYDKEIQHLENRIKDIAKQRDNDLQNEETKKKYNDEIDDLNRQIQAKQKEKNDYINSRRGINTNQNANQNSSARYIFQNGQTAYTDYNIALLENDIRNGKYQQDEKGNPIDTVDKLHSWLRSQGLIDLREQNQNQNQNSATPRNQNQSTSTQNPGNNNSQNSTYPQNVQVTPSDSTNNTDNTEFEPVDVDMANRGIAFRNPSNGEVITKEQFYSDLKRAKEKGIIDRHNIRTEKELVDYYKSQGFKDIRLANSPNRNNTSLAQSNYNQGTGLSPFPTAEEKERAATQGNTGSNIARVPEKQGEALLNGNNPPSENSNSEEYNSEVMWTHPNGRTISKSEYDKNKSDYNDRLRIAGVENPDYDAWLEAEGYRRADNSNSPAPRGTDYVNGTTPQATKRQLAYLNGNEVRYGTTFIGEDLPALMPHGEMTASLTPMGLSRNNSEKYSHGNLAEIYSDDERLPPIPREFLPPSYQIPTANDLGYVTQEPPAYNPYDVNADTGQPYDENDVYEQGFEYDDKQNNGITIPDKQNGGYKVLPFTNDDDNDIYGDMTLLAAHRNPRKRSRRRRTIAHAPVQTRQNTRLYTQNDYPNVRFPRREARRPGQIKTNTSYLDLKPVIDDSAKNHGLEPELIRGIIQIESRWDSNATGPKTIYGHAKGLMQLLDGTARDMRVRDSYDAAQNINGGSKYIAQLIRQFNGNVAHALMAYNWGPDNMRKALKGRKSIPAGVRKYARDILNIYNRLKSRRG